jgi:glutamate synthase domain-containing protein 2
MNDPMAIAQLQQATRDNDKELYRKFSEANLALSRRVHLRGLLKFKESSSIPLEQVEPAANMVKRFCTGAMSYGSISLEAHTTLAKVCSPLGHHLGSLGC